MNAGVTTSSGICLGLLLALLACKRFKGEEKAPDPGATSASQSGSDPGKSTGASDTMELPGLVAIGATAELNSLKLRVAEVKDCKYESESSQKGLEKAGEKLVGLLVYFEGDYVDHSVQANAHSWKAYDAEGITYPGMTTYATDCQPMLKTVSLAKGDKSKGWMAFKVPVTTKQLDAKYTHNIPPSAAKESAKQVVKFRVIGK